MRSEPGEHDPKDQKVYDFIMRAARVQGPLEGITPEEWIDKNFVYNPNADKEAEDFWRERRARAIPGAWRSALAAIPNGPPNPGDEID